MRVYPNPEMVVNGQPVRVRDPQRGDYLPAEGRHVPRDSYWLRRKTQGDVIEGMPPEAAAGSPSAPGEVEITGTAEGGADSVDDNAAKMPHYAADIEVVSAPKPRRGGRGKNAKSGA